MNQVPYSKQVIDSDDIEAVVNALSSPFITQGEIVPLFEQELAAKVHAAHCTVMSSATASLLTLYKALHVGSGSIVWTVPNTFAATANAALLLGAQIDFVDIDRSSWNISVSALRDKLVAARKSNVLPKIVVLVHFAGLSCEQEAIAELGDEFGFITVEDASHALGGSYQGAPIGSCRYSKAAVFSFHAVKSITTGEGGAVVTNDPSLDERCKLLRSHGITRDRERFTTMDHGGWFYELQDMGWNHRLTDFQSALGRSQLRKLDAFISQRKRRAVKYRTLLEKSSYRFQGLVNGAESAHHLFVVHLGDKCHRRRELFDFLRSRGILTNVHYIPLHLQPAYERKGFSRGMFPASEWYYQGALSIPLFPTLSDDEQAYVVEALKDAESEILNRP